jgi:lysophospholipase L1-like esterase
LAEDDSPDEEEPGVVMERGGGNIERYVALGDSYTIGEGVPPDEAWPSVLVAHLRHEGTGIDLIANPSITGWTSSQLIEHELPVFDDARPTFATVLIGVNDWVQGVEAEAFRANLHVIVDRVQSALPDPRKVILLTIPDFSVTPAGAQYSRGRDITAGIAAFNDVIAGVAREREVALVDLFPLSRELTAPEFVAEDGLHPSGAAYARWEQQIFPVALQVLQPGGA